MVLTMGDVVPICPPTESFHFHIFFLYFFMAISLEMSIRVTQISIFADTVFKKNILKNQSNLGFVTMLICSHCKIRSVLG